ncbi:hypothetical protein ACBY01_04525 [Sphingomonas sp. ac-8]|uniref:hypothetical protein n=1 Tax=Sphingomonas sp. ac-8 TaxID=3242977 RepID=UPI003A810884
MTAMRSANSNALLAMLAALALFGCSGSDATATDRRETPEATGPTSGRAPFPTLGQQTKGSSVETSMQCGSSELERASCMIQLILADLKANYRATGGGGITSIKAGVGMSYSVALPHEERSDIFTYEFEEQGGKIAIKSKKDSTESY